MTKCQKDSTCSIFLKGGLFKGIKNDISMCQTCKYTNTNTQIQNSGQTWDFITTPSLGQNPKLFQFLHNGQICHDDNSCLHVWQFYHVFKDTRLSIRHTAPSLCYRDSLVPPASGAAEPVYGLFASIARQGTRYICVFVLVYLHVRHLGTLFLRSLYHYLFKYIAHVGPICNFDQNCICVFCICLFLYLSLCVCTSDTWEHCF